MPRPLRLDYADARQHVMNRGARSEPIFRDNDDCMVFLGLLAELPVRFGVEVHGYALMGNHYHLLLVSRHGRLSEAMGFVQSRFARHQNRVHRWDGPIFRGRFKNRLVEDDGYWRHVLAYVHLNPVTAHLVGKPEEARWTSHRAYVGLDTAPEWLETAELLGLFGGANPLAAYVWEVQVGRQAGPDGFRADRLWSARSTLPPEPAPPGLVSADQAFDEVERVTGLERGDIEQTRRGRSGHPARLVAMWWLAERAGLGTNTISRLLAVDPAVVSRGVRRVRRTDEDPLAGWRDALHEVQASKSR